MTGTPSSDRANLAARHADWTWRALIGAAVVLAMANAAFYLPRTVDDAFISLRYAANLVAGRGLVYNPGEWVEGYSSLLWALAQAAGLGVGLDGVTATKLWGAVATVALFVGVYRLGREAFGLGPRVAAAALVLLGANSYVLSWCFYGLETPLHLALFVWFGVWVRRVADGQPGTLPLAAVGIAATLTRPEAPLLLAAMGPAAAGAPRSLAELQVRLRRLLPAAALVVAGFGAWLLVRHALYGLWVPHTYYAKQGSGLTWTNLNPLHTEGATLHERLWWPVAALGAAVAAVRTRRPVALFVGAMGLFFVVRVEMDWMPNLRHLLPVWVVSTLAVAALAQALLVASPRATAVRLAARAVGAGVVALAGAMLVHLVTIDSRFSPYDHQTHGGGEVWIRRKTTNAWRATAALLRRQPPPGFENANPDHLGLIQQTFVAIEASSRPEEETWFFGRDIGMVGYFSPINVYDTDGLFTPDSVRWTEGRDRQPIDDEAVVEAFKRPFVAGEVYFEWTDALGRRPELLSGFDVTLGSRRRPHRFEQRDHARPDAAALRARYERAQALAPQWFYFSELYGSPAGPGLDLRARVAVERAELGADAVQPTALVPVFAAEAAALDAAVRLHGCTVEPAAVAPGERALLTCWFERLRGTTRGYRVFVHGFGPTGRVLHADHPIAQGYVALGAIAADHVVRSRAWLQVPTDVAPGTDIDVRVGLFDGDHRAVVTPPDRADGDNRVPAATLRVE